MRATLGLLIALTALAAAGRLLLLAVPNVSLTFFVVAVAGLGWGPRLGAAVGLLAMLVTSAMLGGPTPGALAGAAAVAGLGALAGLLRPLGFPGPRRALAQTAAAAFLGAAMQVVFSVTADALGWALFAWLPQGQAAAPLLLPLLAAGLLFNVPAAIFQAALFGSALQPTLAALRAAGLAAEVEKPRVREVVLADAA
ncbi:MAG TPA: hypothetical protein VGR28_13740 [Candidatus Thermoplasmatota archaeon]|jgi:hypothetical protein|nr:hypothetical protein [Candidatus Thermoplasmatota archaeon]